MIKAIYKNEEVEVEIGAEQGFDVLELELSLIIKAIYSVVTEAAEEAGIKNPELASKNFISQCVNEGYDMEAEECGEEPTLMEGGLKEEEDSEHKVVLDGITYVNGEKNKLN